MCIIFFVFLINFLVSHGPLISLNSILLKSILLVEGQLTTFDHLFFRSKIKKIKYIVTFF
jgi:hypothetical protein